ncbi:MAG: YfhO family protein [Flammeovirgaceae bacterium]|nr:YfhO family protein [Flammeovirgaceae bacterium]
MRRYQDLYDSGILRDQNELIQDAQRGTLDFTKYNVLNMLNTKYIVYGPSRNNVIKNTASFGSAWFVEEAIEVSSPSEEISETVDHASQNTAVVDISKFVIPAFQSDSSATVRLVEKKPSYLKYESTSGADGLIVFSEIYYPKGWRAQIDGGDVNILRVNYVLRGLSVKAGNHVIEFYFEPKPYTIGNVITMASGWLVLLVFGACIGWDLKSNGLSSKQEPGSD